MGAKLTVLVLDDEEGSLENLGKVIGNKIPKAEVTITQKSQECLSRIRNSMPDIFIYDFDSPRALGTNILKTLYMEKITHSMPTIALTSLGKAAEELKEIYLDPVKIVHKPVKVSEIMGVLTSVIQGEPKTTKAPTLVLEPGEFLFHEGDTGQSFYFVKSGRLNVLVKGDSQERKVGEVTTNEIVGEMAFIDGSPRSASVTAEEPTELLEIHVDNLDRAIKSNPVLASAIIKTLTSRLRKLIHEE